MGAAQAALEALIRRAPWDWGLVALRGGAWGAGFALFVFVFQAVRRRRPDRDREDGRAMVEEALRTGRLPEDLIPAAWRRAMTEEVTSDRQSRWAATGMGLVIAVLVAVVAVIDADPLVGLLAVLLVAGTAVGDRWCARRVRRAEELLAALDRTDAHPG